MPSDLAATIGEEEAQLLAAAFGAGQRLFVPSSTAHAEHLEIILGMPATSLLVHAYGGNYVYLPGLPRADGKRREPSLALVAALSKKPKPGLSAAAIARQFRVSVRNVYSKRAEIRRREKLGIALDAPTRRKHCPPKKSRDRRNGVRPRQSVIRELMDQ